MRLFLCLLWFLLLSVVWGGVLCPQCGFENEDNDRYCLNCTQEMRSLTAAEKQAIQKQQEQKKKEKAKSPSSSPRRKLNAADKEPPKYSKAHQKYTFTAGYGGAARLGMHQRRVQKVLNLKRRTWGDRRTTKVSNKLSTKYLDLIFEEHKLVSWEVKTVRKNFKMKIYDSRATDIINAGKDYPLQKKDLKPGMTYRAVIDLWGIPDEKIEKNSYESYSLEMMYYKDNPGDPDAAKAYRNKRLPRLNLTFDYDKKLSEITETE